MKLVGWLMSLDALRNRFGREWPAINKAKHETAARLDQLRTIACNGVGGSPIDSDDISVVAFGSLAREEWTSGSDLDWTLLIDGVADHGHANTALHLSSLLNQAGFKDPGRTG